MRVGALPDEHRPDEHRPDEHRPDDESRERLALVRSSLTTPTLAHERTLGVAAGLRVVVPSGRLPRGGTLAVQGSGATALALALAAEAVREGAFLAVVAPSSFGLAACLDFDIPLRRVVQFVLPATDAWAQSVAAIIDGFDVVMLVGTPAIRPTQARQLVARNRERGSVVLQVASPPWPDGADLRFDVRGAQWSGLGQGYGSLRARQVVVQVAGRRHRGAARRYSVMLPAADGAVRAHAVASSDGLGEERFAGSDIDALLDAVDGADRGRLHHQGRADQGRADQGRADQGRADQGRAAGDVDAIA